MCTDRQLPNTADRVRVSALFSSRHLTTSSHFMSPSPVSTHPYNIILNLNNQQSCQASWLWRCWHGKISGGPATCFGFFVSLRNSQTSVNIVLDSWWYDVLHGQNCLHCWVALLLDFLLFFFFFPKSFNILIAGWMLRNFTQMWLKKMLLNILGATTMHINS